MSVLDVTTAIDGENSSSMLYLEAQNKIKGCIDNMTLTVATEQKYGLLWWQRKETSLIQDELASAPQGSLHKACRPELCPLPPHLPQLFPGSSQTSATTQLASTPLKISKTLTTPWSQRGSQQADEQHIFRPSSASKQTCLWQRVLKFTRCFWRNRS